MRILDGKRGARRLSAAARGALPAAVLAAGLGACGGDPVCGNGVKETGEQCDHGLQNGAEGDTCSASCNSISVLVPQVQVTWGLLGKTSVSGYRGAECTEVGAAQAHVVLSGPATVDEYLDCTQHSKLYAAACATADATCTTKLPAGDYSVTVTLVDGQKQALSKAVKAGPVTAKPGPAVDLVVDFGMGDFLKSDYTGALQLRTSWGADAVKCADATPAVTQEAIWLVPEGKSAPVAGISTKGGTSLAGTPGTCYTAMGIDFYEVAQGIPWGAYSLVLRGLGADGKEHYCGQYPVYVGPSNNDQPWTFTVPQVAAQAPGTSATTCP